MAWRRINRVVVNRLSPIMTTYFRNAAQIQSRADYEKILRSALSKPGAESFHYLDNFKFDKKEAPLVLVGDIGKPLLEELKKASPKSVYAKGSCKVTEQDQVIFDLTAGKLKQKTLAAAIKSAGIKSAVTLNGGEPDDDAQGGADAGAGDVVTSTSSPEDGAKPKLPELGKQWQEKVKLIKPAFDLVLKKARGIEGSTWADDLDGAYSQMLLEAKGGNFDAAMKSLALLARMMKSEEASRAEAKHQTLKSVDPYYAEFTQRSSSELGGKENIKEIRSENKEKGQGTTEDGTMTYALPVSPKEWESGVLKPMAEVIDLADEKPFDAAQAHELATRALAVVARAGTHAMESDGRFPEREQALGKLMHEGNLLVNELSYFLATESLSNEELARKLEALIEQTSVARPGDRSPSPLELEAFKKDAPKRKLKREAKIRELIDNIKRTEESIKRGEEIMSNGSPENWPKHLEGQLKYQKENLAAFRKDLNLRVERLKSGEDENDALKGFMDRLMPSEATDALLKALNSATAQIKQDELTEAIMTLDQALNDCFDMAKVRVDMDEAKLKEKCEEAVQSIQQSFSARQASVGNVRQHANATSELATKVTPLLS